MSTVYILVHHVEKYCPLSLLQEKRYHSLLILVPLLVTELLIIFITSLTYLNLLHSPLTMNVLIVGQIGVKVLPVFDGNIMFGMIMCHAITNNI